MVFPVAAAIGAAGSIAGGLLGKSSGPQTSKWYRNQSKDLYNQASDIASQPFNPYTDPRFADFTPDQLAAFDAVKGNLGLGSGAVNNALTTAQGAANYTPQQVTAGTIAPMQIGVNYNPAAVNAQSVSGAYNYTPQGVSPSSVSAERIASKNFTDYDISKYMNPYTQQVIDTTLNDLNTDRLRTTNAQKADMMAANAWGGSRSGVAQALTNEGYGNTAASTTAGLRNQAFNAASGLIQQDAGRDLTAKQSNQATSLQAGMTNASLALQAALANQSAGIQNAQFGANLGLQAGVANQGANLQSQLANLQSSQFGANLGLTAAQSNQRSALDAAVANLTAGLDAQKVNQYAGLQANSQALQGANLMGQLGGIQQNMGLTDSNALLQIGNQQQQQTQLPMDFAYQQWLQQQAWPQQQLSWQQSFLKDPKGVAAQYPQQNQALGILGGALTGGQLATGIYDAFNQQQTTPYSQTLGPITASPWATNPTMQPTGPVTFDHPYPFNPFGGP